MSDPGSMSPLQKNQALAEWLEYQLRQVRNRIRELTVKEQQERRAQERARAEQSWKIQPQRSNAPALLHRGGCTLYTNEFGFISREEAVIALAEPDIEACQICAPQSGLEQGDSQADRP